MFQKHIILACALSVLVGCSSAQKASEVQAVRAPLAPYLKLDCNELAAEQGQLISQADVARTEVDAAYDSDKTTELVTWILFAPMAFALDGNQEQASKLASIKGQMESVDEAMKINSCSSKSVQISSKG